MKKWQIVFRPDYYATPMSFWVHIPLDGEVWRDAKQFAPPLPKAVPGKGFPLLLIRFLGVELEFASVEEAEHFWEVIAQKHLRSTRELSRKRTEDYGPNRHWLSRLPSKLKPWKQREKLIPILQEGIVGLRSAYQD